MDRDRLERARRDADRHDWGQALSGWRELAPDGPSTADLSTEDQITWGITEFLSGHPDQAVRALQSAHHRQIEHGAVEAALHSAFLLATIFDLRGQSSMFQGWLGRAERQLALIESPSDAAVVGRGFLAMLELRRALGAGRFDQMGPLADEIAEIGHRQQQPDLIAMGVLSQGRLNIYGGDVARGLAQLDEALSGVWAAEVSPLVAGVVLCTAIEGCQEVGAVDRLCQWSDGLSTWCADQPGLAVFTGAAALHHGQTLILRGEWDAGLAALTAASERYLSLGQHGSAGVAERERGDLLRLRGRLEEAKAAYQGALTHGCDPHPGLALLWLAEGRADDAAVAVRRLLEELVIPAQRGRVLPAAIDVLLAVDDTTYAEGLAQELDLLAEVTDCAPIAATAARVHAQVELARGDAAGAVPYARKAMHLWSDTDAPFEVARARLVLADALTAVGDVQSGQHERQEATARCEALGAVLPADVSSSAGTRGSGGLTPREVEVLTLVAGGASNRAIATELVLSERTVARHLSNIFGKLGVTSRTAAAHQAHQHHLVARPGR
ncbi:LuxR C-terminal-related transcriptional regulator [Ornithinimicrobium faecis]|uniref:LuxR C-terminal-related transcriptional regulator n=1 Tax=Ornithinimicrobium faecis TaxID=2934158 RepID=UPI0022B71584|nr:LuxR C-terminal-related transcriptional regulator [Ornithinimicrobium sp. HY1745]